MVNIVNYLVSSPLSKKKLIDREKVGNCETPLSHHFNTLARDYYGALTHRFKEADIDRYFFIISLVINHEHITQQGIADCLGLEKTYVVKIIDYLDKKGYVKRKTNPDDRRKHILQPTKKALDFYPQLKKNFHFMNDLAFKGFSQKEVEDFYRQLDRIFQNISGLPADQYFVKYTKAEKK